MNLKKPSSAKKELIDRAIAYLRAHDSSGFSLEELADALFINKYYLARTFKEVTGVTPLQYHNQLRCEKAAALLSVPRYTIAGVAYQTGFTSPSHFSRVFRACMGCTPSAYRKMTGEGEDKISPHRK